MPFASITLIDKERQWFKASVGLPFRESSRSVAFCDYTIRSDQAFVVTDAREDERFASNPLVINEPYLRAYVGII
ncbi:MAG: GAF domain-containing protein [Opitutales bacterium]|nr:GAF domain-containing protein [Opitutales bacterium]